jgi:hypothetical protein
LAHPAETAGKYCLIPTALGVEALEPREEISRVTPPDLSICDAGLIIFDLNEEMIR